MYFTSGSDRAFEQLMQGKPGFDHYDSGEAVTPEDCGTCRFYRPHWKYQFCVYAECPYQPGKLTAYDAVTFRVKGVENMAVFRVERNKGYTVMSNHHLRNKDLMYARGRFIVNTSDILIRKFNPIPPPFPNHGKGGGSGGYTPAACRGNSTAGADRQGQAAVKRRCDAPLTARSRLYEKTGGDGGYIPPEP